MNNIIQFPRKLKNLTYEELMLKAHQVINVKTVDVETYLKFMEEFNRRLEIETAKVQKGIKELSELE